MTILTNQRLALHLTILTNQGRVLIARADEQVEVRPSQTLAKVFRSHMIISPVHNCQVIQHNSESSPYARTVVIQNTAQAFKAFGVKNIPRHILDGWARYKREHVPQIVEKQEDVNADTEIGRAHV